MGSGMRAPEVPARSPSLWLSSKGSIASAEIEVEVLTAAPLRDGLGKACLPAALTAAAPPGSSPGHIWPFLNWPHRLQRYPSMGCPASMASRRCLSLLSRGDATGCAPRCLNDLEARAQ